MVERGDFDPAVRVQGGESAALPADHSWMGDKDGHNCVICVERDDTLNMCWPDNHLSPQAENRVQFAKIIQEALGITDPDRLLELADDMIAGLKEMAAEDDLSATRAADAEEVGQTGGGEADV